ncbi:heterokaryon incompatibility protein-domain-containing protein [Xylaria sp. FL0043]|nr:heterokaryon incompatibility protein-domain-containing protein [Xylaria sp. FL0043]
MGLCRACQRIFEGEANLRQLSTPCDAYPSFRHHSYREQLEKAAYDNCFVCSKLWAISCRNPPEDLGDIGWLDAIPRVDPGYVMPQYWTRSHLFLGNHMSPPALDFMVDFSPEPREPAEQYHSYTFESFGLVRIPTIKNESELGESCGENSPDLGAWTSSIVTAQRWLRQCLATHEKCRQPGLSLAADSLPSRLLQIGSPSSGKLRLVEYPVPGTEASRYATVSHCWGSPMTHTMQLTSESASRLRQGIDIADLGQTFQDVILVAQKLGIGYIWIDSLCIIQDSKEDWLMESTHMSTVYRNATINIAATVAFDGLAGCFPPRQLHPAKPCVVQTAWDNFENGTYGIYTKDIWRKFRLNDTSFPLLSRGWVLQEMLLAPRILHLTGEQLIWQCHTVDACEEASFGLPNFPFQYPPAAKRKAFGRHEEPGISADLEAASVPEARKTRLSKQEERRYLNFWSKIVSEYTGKAFSFHTDKLVALSGVSRLMARALGPEYFAGIWGRWMVSDLCWKVRRRFADTRLEDLPPRPSPYRAPSWSWASLEEPIECDRSYNMSYNLQKRLPNVMVNIIDSDTESESEDEKLEDFMRSRSIASIISCDVECVTDDMMGAVAGGTLRVSSRLASLELQPEWKDDRYFVTCNGSTWSYQLYDTTNGGNNVEIRLDCKPPSLRFHCLPVLAPSSSLICLLLCPTGTQKGQFRRYGTIEIHPDSLGLGKSVWEGFLQIANEDWLEFESRDEDGWYTISII